jgi:hypothetical protein
MNLQLVQETANIIMAVSSVLALYKLCGAMRDMFVLTKYQGRKVRVSRFEYIPKGGRR